MNNIKILPEIIIKQIAAGEVIHRPSSVVKELIENSLDAKSTKISIFLSYGGLESIIVNDNGEGINYKNLQIIATSHATNKIFCLKDLLSIKTFGFRGEALSSIKSVSNLSIVSCTKNNNKGYKIFFTENNVLKIEPCPHPKGTTVYVNNLFHNIPIKRNFIKNYYIELKDIQETIRRLSLSCLNVKFFINYNNENLKKYFFFNNYIKTDKYIKKILKYKRDNFFIKIFNCIKNISLQGWIVLFKNKKKYVKNIKYFYVNNRFVNSSFIKKIINTNLQKKIKNNYKLNYILYLNVPYEDICINIHPDKSKINFLFENIVYNFIYKTLKNKLTKLLKKNIFYKTNIILENKHLCKKKHNKKLKLKSENYSYFININKEIFNINFIKKKKYSCKKNYYGKILYSNCFNYVIVQKYGKLAIISIKIAKYFLRQVMFDFPKKKFFHKVLLILPYKIKINDLEKKTLKNNIILLFRLGITFFIKKKILLIKTLPFLLKTKNIEYVIKEILIYLKKNNKNFKETLYELSKITKLNINKWYNLHALETLIVLEKKFPFLLKFPPKYFFRYINMKNLIDMLKT
ncbi:DNA mismatch repair endonuclease MutL [Buchnera aphidicola (Taiwanaphis decaspermi)]|uniref:DNA mismatch repair endonuclease MutL n=1 Tax=Buchnera aphidicola TaxID=9 RepID=UPI0031B81DBF